MTDFNQVIAAEREQVSRAAGVRAGQVSARAAINAQERERASAVFVHAAGLGPEVPGYGATAWRQWLITHVSSNVYYVVEKANPTATPVRYPNWPLASVKADLLAKAA